MKNSRTAVEHISPPKVIEEVSRIKNVSLQTLEIYQTTPRGPIAHFVQPKHMITIPSKEVSTQMKTLAARRMLKIW